MTMDQAVDLVRESFTLMLVLSAPVLVAAVAIGLLISLFQAVTQIQEQTLSFVPKIVGMVVVAIVTTPWVATLLIEYSKRMFGGMD
jgi:flagellar biosynthetic protein FliQ